MNPAVTAVLVSALTALMTSAAIANNTDCSRWPTGSAQTVTAESFVHLDGHACTGVDGVFVTLSCSQGATVVLDAWIMTNASIVLVGSNTTQPNIIVNVSILVIDSAISCSGSAFACVGIAPTTIGGPVVLTDVSLTAVRSSFSITADTSLSPSSATVVGVALTQSDSHVTNISGLSITLGPRVKVSVLCRTAVSVVVVGGIGSIVPRTSASTVMSNVALTMQNTTVVVNCTAATFASDSAIAIGGVAVTRRDVQVTNFSSRLYGGVGLSAVSDVSAQANLLSLGSLAFGTPTAAAVQNVSLVVDDAASLLAEAAGSSNIVSVAVSSVVAASVTGSFTVAGIVIKVNLAEARSQAESTASNPFSMGSAIASVTARAANSAWVSVGDVFITVLRTSAPSVLGDFISAQSFGGSGCAVVASVVVQSTSMAPLTSVAISVAASPFLNPAVIRAVTTQSSDAYACAAIASIVGLSAGVALTNSTLTLSSGTLQLIANATGLPDVVADSVVAAIAGVASLTDSGVSRVQQLRITVMDSDNLTATSRFTNMGALNMAAAVVGGVALSSADPDFSDFFIVLQRVQRVTCVAQGTRAIALTSVGGLAVGQTSPALMRLDNINLVMLDASFITAAALSVLGGGLGNADVAATIGGVAVATMSSTGTDANHVLMYMQRVTFAVANATIADAQSNVAASVGALTIAVGTGTLTIGNSTFAMLKCSDVTALSIGYEASTSYVYGGASVNGIAGSYDGEIHIQDAVVQFLSDSTNVGATSYAANPNVVYGAASVAGVTSDRSTIHGELSQVLWQSGINACSLTTVCFKNATGSACCRLEVQINNSSPPTLNVTVPNVTGIVWAAPSVLSHHSETRTIALRRRRGHSRTATPSRSMESTASLSMPRRSAPKPSRTRPRSKRSRSLSSFRVNNTAPPSTPKAPHPHTLHPRSITLIGVFHSSPGPTARSPLDGEKDAVARSVGDEGAFASSVVATGRIASIFVGALSPASANKPTVVSRVATASECAVLDSAGVVPAPWTLLPSLGLGGLGDDGGSGANEASNMLLTTLLVTTASLLLSVVVMYCT